MHFMKSISSVLKRRKKTRNIFLTKKQAYILHSIHRKGRGNNLCLFKRSAAIVAAASISAQKQKKDDDPTAVVAAVVITATATVVSKATHQTDDPKDTGAAVSTVSKQGISAAIITATVIVTSTSCATSGITTTSAITSTIGSR